MSKLRYRIYDGTPYLIGFEGDDKDTLTINVDGVESGYLRIGNTGVRINKGEGKLPVCKIEYGKNRVELVTTARLIKLFSIERGVGGAYPIIDREELCTLYRELLQSREELAALKTAVDRLNDAMFKTTIL